MASSYQSSSCDNANATATTIDDDDVSLENLWTLLDMDEAAFTTTTTTTVVELEGNLPASATNSSDGDGDGAGASADGGAGQFRFETKKNKHVLFRGIYQLDNHASVTEGKVVKPMGSYLEGIHVCLPEDRALTEAAELRLKLWSVAKDGQPHPSWLVPAGTVQYSPTGQSHDSILIKQLFFYYCTGDRASYPVLKTDDKTVEMLLVCVPNSSGPKRRKVEAKLLVKKRGVDGKDLDRSKAIQGSLDFFF